MLFMFLLWCKYIASLLLKGLITYTHKHTHSHIYIYSSTHRVLYMAGEGEGKGRGSGSVALVLYTTVCMPPYAIALHNTWCPIAPESPISLLIILCSYYLIIPIISNFFNYFKYFRKYLKMFQNQIFK